MPLHNRDLDSIIIIEDTEGNVKKNSVRYQANRAARERLKAQSAGMAEGWGVQRMTDVGENEIRRFPADRGSSSLKEALKSGKKPSRNIIYKTADESQQQKTAIENGLVVDSDKEKRAALSVIAKQARLGNMSATALNEILSRLKKEIKSFKKEKKTLCSIRLLQVENAAKS